MKRLDKQSQVYQEDSLVIRWADRSSSRKIFYQGKRISSKIYSKYSWIREMVRIYVEQGTIESIKFIRDKTHWSLKDCKSFLDSIRNPNRRWF